MSVHQSHNLAQQKDTGPENGAVSGLSKGVNLDLCCVFLLEDLVKVDKDVSRFVRRPFRRKSELLGHVEGCAFGEPGRKWYRRSDDGVRVLRRDLFNIHSALVRRNKDDAL